MSQFVHPNLNDVPLPIVLHALGDSVRLQIVQNLAREGELSCAKAAPEQIVAKSTRSNHFKVLRAAGIVRTRKAGRIYLSSLRREELDERYPGVLDSVLAAAVDQAAD
ncbi:MAG: helix-turn-helix transcriptional regulator [Pseudomonadota bacterium]